MCRRDHCLPHGLVQTKPQDSRATIVCTLPQTLRTRHRHLDRWPRKQKATSSNFQLPMLHRLLLVTRTVGPQELCWSSTCCHSPQAISQLNGDGKVEASRIYYHAQNHRRPDDATRHHGVCLKWPCRPWLSHQRPLHPAR